MCLIYMFWNSNSRSSNCIIVIFLMFKCFGDDFKVFLLQNSFLFLATTSKNFQKIYLFIFSVSSRGHNPTRCRLLHWGTHLSWEHGQWVVARAAATFTSGLPTSTADYDYPDTILQHGASTSARLCDTKGCQVAPKDSIRFFTYKNYRWLPTAL